MIWVMIAAVVLLDQFTKYIIRSGYEVGETLPVIRDVFHITYIQNRGAAFSMFQNMHLMTIVFPLVAVIACAALIVRSRKQGDRFLTIALGLIVAGGIGNLIDRLHFGFVTDMLDFRIFPVFNIADIGITVGCVLAFIWVIWIDGRDRRGHEGKVADAHTEDDD